MSQSKYTRVEALERKLAWDTSPLSLPDYTKWFLMFTEKQGTGYATGDERTLHDWDWFNKNENKFIETSKLLRHKKIFI